MQPVSPVLSEDYKPFEKVYAKDQLQYNQLPVIRHQDGVLLSRWRLSAEERAAIANGADIMLTNHTFNQPLQPVRLEVCGDHLDDIAALASRMGLPLAVYGETQRRIGYGHIILVREGDDAVVKIERGGKQIEVIREGLDGNFSHCVSPIGIESAIANADA